MQYPSVSVIIPTKNRPDDLDLAVQSLFRQTTIPGELIIVDQSENPESQHRIEKRYAEAPPQTRDALRVSYIHDSGIAGGAIARNRAMEIAHGDIWVFLDDDVELDPRFLEELLNVYARCPRADGVSGIITNYRRPKLAVRIWSWIFVRGPFRDERQPVYWNADLLRSSDPVAVSRLGGGVMSFRAAAIRGLRFDVNLRGVSDGEDVDFCIRLPPGTVLLIAPRARLIHHRSPLGRSEAHPLRRFSQANCYLYQKHWRKGVFNRVLFLWLCVGLGVAASIASLRRGSLDPWRALMEGMREGTRVGNPKSDV